jgi:hypothetical protein
MASVCGYLPYGDLIMSWDIVRDELLASVVSLMAVEKQDDGRRWVDLLELEKDEDGKRLGACIVIDVRHGAVPATTFASILDCLDFSKEACTKSAIWAFHDALQSHPSSRSNPCHFVCCSNFSVEHTSESMDEYVRVLDISDFIIYVLDENGHHAAALTQDDRDRAKRMYFRSFDDPWEAIDRMWSGGKGRVFVTALKDLIELLSDDDDPARNINDALGLGMKGNLDFVAVKYPSGINLTVHQPTTLDGNWANTNWYLSHKGDNRWGLTHRCSGIGSQARERVHKALPIIEEGFSGLYIGPPKGAVHEDRAKLLEDAFARL